MKPFVPLMLLLTILAPLRASAEPRLLGVQDPLEEELREALLWKRTDAQVGVGLGAVLVATGGLAAYRTSTMCDESVDPADDCDIVRGLAAVGTGTLLSVGTLILVWAGVDWYGAERALQEMKSVPSMAVSVGRDNALVTFEVHF